jgi:hypothetical protein
MNMSNMLAMYPKEMSPIQSQDDIKSGNRLFSATKDHLFSDLNGEGVILNLKNGKYYGLNQVGLSIWSAIQKPSTFQEILDLLLREYEVDNEICSQEIISFLKKMADESLLEFSDEKVI